MSYREENGRVILTISREDYEILLMALGALTVVKLNEPGEPQRMLGLVNRLNQGNPNYTPYQVDPGKR